MNNLGPEVTATEVERRQKEAFARPIPNPILEALIEKVLEVTRRIINERPRP